MRCVWCRPTEFSGQHYHLNGCPVITGVYPSVKGQECNTCGDLMDHFMYAAEGKTTVCVCLGCAAVEALV